jgi:hypothetical protein
MTGFTVAAILFLPAPGSSLDAGGTLLFYYPPRWMKCAFYLVSFMSLTDSLGRESRGRFSLSFQPHAKQASFFKRPQKPISYLRPFLPTWPESKLAPSR